MEGCQFSARSRAISTGKSDLANRERGHHGAVRGHAAFLVRKPPEIPFQTRLPALSRHRLLLRLLAAAMAAILAACSPLPPKTAMKAGWKASPNFDGRRPNLVIIHHTGNPTLEQALYTLTSSETSVRDNEAKNVALTH